jgi:uncharacterized membrane protein
MEDYNQVLKTTKKKEDNEIIAKILVENRFLERQQLPSTGLLKVYKSLLSETANN